MNNEYPILKFLFEGSTNSAPICPLVAVEYVARKPYKAPVEEFLTQKWLSSIELSLNVNDSAVAPCNGLVEPDDAADVLEQV